MGQACDQQKPNVLQKTEALSPPVSFADAGMFLGPLENTLQQTEQEFSSQLFDSHSPGKKRLVEPPALVWVTTPTHLQETLQDPRRH